MMTQRMSNVTFLNSWAKDWWLHTPNPSPKRPEIARLLWVIQKAEERFSNGMPLKNKEVLERHYEAAVNTYVKLSKLEEV